MGADGKPFTVSINGPIIASGRNSNVNEYELEKRKN